jgi:hypothetical protein
MMYLILIKGERDHRAPSENKSMCFGPFTSVGRSVNGLTCSTHPFGECAWFMTDLRGCVYYDGYWFQASDVVDLVEEPTLAVYDKNRAVQRNLILRNGDNVLLTDGRMGSPYTGTAAVMSSHGKRKMDDRLYSLGDEWCRLGPENPPVVYDAEHLSADALLPMSTAPLFDTFMAGWIIEGHMELRRASYRGAELNLQDARTGEKLHAPDGWLPCPYSAYPPFPDHEHPEKTKAEEEVP